MDIPPREMNKCLVPSVYSDNKFVRLSNILAQKTFDLSPNCPYNKAMRDWYLGAGDPLCLILAADARLCTPDYANDHIWELELGSGEPAAISLHTTYGLRARSMRLFPRFTENGKVLAAPTAFAAPPRLRRFYPNFLLLNFSPLAGIEVTTEWWLPQSQAAAGRLTIVNHTTAQRLIKLEWCGLLVPLEGQSLAPIQIQSVHVLAGRSGELAPVIFLTGGAEAGPGPYPSLALELDLGPGASRQLSWAQAALPDQQASFELARRSAARPWDAERARIELLNASQTIEIQTGDPEWDAALAFSQKAALSLFFPGNDHLPHPSFVLARQPDHGCSQKGDGSDYPHLWNGQSPLEAYYLASLLPGEPRLAQGLVRNFMAAQTADGAIDCKPGLAGQRGRRLAAPLLASLAWNLYQVTGDEAFLAEVFPRLLAFCRAWLARAHDRDRDGFPEWEHPLQTGFEDNPFFAPWYDWTQGVDIAVVESPALAAALYRECQTLIAIAERLEMTPTVADLQASIRKLRAAVEDCWNARRTLYHYRDRDSHVSSAGKVLARQRGAGTLRLKQTFEQPVRLLIQIQAKRQTARRPEVVISEYVTKKGKGETLSGQAFHWRASGAVATSQKVYSRIGKIDVRGVHSKDKVIVRSVDYTYEDHTLFLPLWAGIPDLQRAQALIGRALLDAERFDRPFGAPACPAAPDEQAESSCLNVHFPWNQLIGEGLLAYGYRAEAARLTAHLVTAAIQNLKANRAFYQYYHAEKGTGLGERNALHGLAPVGLFLQTLGVQILSAENVRLEGQNPFPWPVTVRYRGLTVVRAAERTEVTFANGRTVTVTNPEPCLVSA